MSDFEGVYTFYNAEAGVYLSYTGRTLTLSKTPSPWSIQSVDANSFYVYADGSDLLLDIHNAYVAEGTTVKLWEKTGYNVQIWKLSPNVNGSCSFLSSVNDVYCLGFKNGYALLQKRGIGTMQEWQAKRVGDIKKDYLSLSSHGGVIELRLSADVSAVISTARLQKWANDLEKAYYSFYELTTFKPYDKIIVEANKPLPYKDFAGYVLDGCNTIFVSPDFLYTDLAKMTLRTNDWSFCVLHEMGHMFDCGRPWNFETEMMTDLKLAYVLERNGASATPAEFGASVSFTGADIKNAYKTLGKDFSCSYDIFGCTYRFLQIKDNIGWELFKQTYRYMQEHYSEYSKKTKTEKLESFVGLLSHYIGKNVRAYFSDKEWAVLLSKTGNKKVL